MYALQFHLNLVKNGRFMIFTFPTLEGISIYSPGLMLTSQLATSFLDYFEKTLRMFTQIGDCLHRFQTYARLYPQSQHVSDALVRSYGHILEFVWDCRSFFLQAKRDKTSVSGHFSCWSTPAATL
jgi:hypothetical protein